MCCVLLFISPYCMIPRPVPVSTCVLLVNPPLCSQFLALMAQTGWSGSSDDTANFHCYCKLRPCTVHGGGSPPVGGRGSSASI